MFEADQNSGGVRWQVVPVRAGSTTEVVILATRFLPLTVHWVGRSVCCSGPRCSLCAWLPARGLFYLPVIFDKRVSILELPSLAQSHFEQHCNLLHDGVRVGLIVRLSRRSAKAPIHTEVVGEREGLKEIDMLLLASRVMAVYQMPGPNPGEDLESYSSRVSVIAARRGEIEFERLKRTQEATSSSR